MVGGTLAEDGVVAVVVEEVWLCRYLRMQAGKAVITMVA